MFLTPDFKVKNWYKFDIRTISDDEYNKWYQMMSKDKKQRVDKLCLNDDKKRTVVGEMLVRKAISELFSTPPESIVFGVKENGKPFAKDIPIEFNISHSGNMVVCAISDTPVGIDIEQIRPVDLSVAKRICTENELIYIFGKKPETLEFKISSDKEILRRFFKIWTTKEAYAKNIGAGIKSIKTDTSKILAETFYFDDYVLSIY